MHRNHSLKQLDIYEDFWRRLENMAPDAPRLDAEQKTLHSMRTFLRESSQAFDRDFAPGHMTGSILILNADWTKCLLMHHKKLHKWLQLGGHADGCSLLEEVALKEGSEESGLKDIALVPILDLFCPQVAGPQPSMVIPFDIDIHLIPANAKDGAHFHFDFRFLAVTQKPDDIVLAREEAHDLKWFSHTEALQQSLETSMLRQWQKWAYFRMLIEKRQN